MGETNGKGSDNERGDEPGNDKDEEKNTTSWAGGIVAQGSNHCFVHFSSPRKERIALKIIEISHIVARRSERHHTKNLPRRIPHPFYERDLKDITRRIVRAAHPGHDYPGWAHGYGVPQPDSDLDLLVVMDEQGSHAEQSPRFRIYSPSWLYRWIFRHVRG